MLKGLRRGYRVLCTTLGKSEPLDALRSTEKPVALVLGNEVDGLPRATLDACDGVVTIPSAGHMQSLNVSASAAIFLYALRHLG